MKKFKVLYSTILLYFISVSCHAQNPSSTVPWIDNFVEIARQSDSFTVGFITTPYDSTLPTGIEHFVDNIQFSMVYYCKSRCANSAIVFKKMTNGIRSVECEKLIYDIQLQLTKEDTSLLSVYVSTNGRNIRHRSKCFNLSKSIKPQLHTPFTFF